jgi:hypothetical protein
MIISIRGTNGSGKSTVVRQLLEAGIATAIYGLLGVARPEAYKLVLNGVSAPVYILGPYNVPTGGCDQITHYDSILALVEKYSAKGHVIFEGVIVGSVWGRMGALLEKSGEDAVMLYLTTSLEDCISRVQQRRDIRKDAREFNPKNLAAKYHATAKIREKVVEAGLVRVVGVSSEEAAEAIQGLLEAV